MITNIKHFLRTRLYSFFLTRLKLPQLFAVIGVVILTMGIFNGILGSITQGLVMAETIQDGQVIQDKVVNNEAKSSSKTPIVVQDELGNHFVYVPSGLDIPVKMQTFYIQDTSTNGYVPYDAAMHVITEDTDIELKYVIDIEAYFLTEMGKKVQAMIAQEQADGKEVGLRFGFEIDRDINIPKVLGGSLSDANGEMGEFTITPNGGNPVSEGAAHHAWQVTIYPESFANGKTPTIGNMNFNAKLSVSEFQEEKEIYVNKEGTIEPILIEVNQGSKNWHMRKQATHTESKPVALEVAGQSKELYLIEWEVELSQGRATTAPYDYLPLTGFTLRDSDQTAVAPGVAAGNSFQFPSGEVRAALEKIGLPLYRFQIRNAQGKWEDYVPGEDEFVIKTYGGNNDMEFVFSPDSPLSKQPFKIFLNSYTKDFHHDEIKNRAVAKADGFQDLTVSGSFQWDREDLFKKASYVSEGIVKWEVSYFNQEKAAKVLSDLQSSGEIQLDTLKIVDSNNGRTGYQVFPEEGSYDSYKNLYLSDNPLVAVTETNGGKGFDLDLSENLPVGRYLISYHSTYDPKDGKLTNQISGGSHKSEASGEYEPKLSVIKDVLEQFNDKSGHATYRQINYNDKTILWQSKIIPITGGGDLTIRDSSAETKTHYGDLFYYHNPTASGTLDKDGKPSQEYMKEKGIIVVIQNDDGSFSELELAVGKEEIDDPLEQGTIFVSNRSSKNDSGGVLSSLDENDQPTKRKRHSGFVIHLPAELVQKEFYVYVATKFGAIDPEQHEKNSHPGQYRNRMEVNQNGLRDASVGKTTGGVKDTIYLSNKIHKTNQPDFANGIITWQVLANINTMTLRKDDTFTDTLSVGQFFTKEQLDTLQLTQIIPDETKNLMGQDRHFLETPLVKGQDYQVDYAGKVTGKDQYSGYKITLLKDLGQVMLRMDFASTIEFPDPETASTTATELKNTITQNLSTVIYTASSSVSVVYADQDNIKKESLGGYDEINNIIPWQLVINESGIAMKDLLIRDFPSEQSVNPGNVRVQRGKKEYVYNATDKVWQLKIVPDPDQTLVEGVDYNINFGLYNDDTNTTEDTRGFTVEFIESAQNPENVVKYPVLINYETVPDLNALNPGNAAKFKYGDKETILDTVKVYVRDVAVSGDLASDFAFTINLKKLAAYDNDKFAETPLADAHFTLTELTTNQVQNEVTLNSGYLSFEKLHIGRYKLEETQAPDGFQLRKDPIYFLIDRTGNFHLTDQDGNYDPSNPIKDPLISVSRKDQSPYIELKIKNEFAAPQVSVEKILIQGEELTEDKVFTFEIRRKDDQAVMAYGKTTITASNKKSPIEFYQDASHQVPVTDWQTILVDDESYQLVELDNQEYQVDYSGWSGISQLGSFVVDFDYNDEINILVTNRAKYQLPEAGGRGQNLVVILFAGVLIIIGACGGLLPLKKENK